jgi:hypothetical protein
LFSDGWAAKSKSSSVFRVGNRAAFNAHFAGHVTHYFTRNDDRRARWTLVMIDVDCHKAGTPQGARDFAGTVMDEFEGQYVYFEPSTNGKGQHGYVLIDKQGYTPERVNEALKHLEKYLTYLQRKHNARIEMVEVKGTLNHGHRYEWDRYDGNRLKDVTFGSLAKLPRQARLDELLDTLRLSVDEIVALEIPADEPPATQPKTVRVGSTTGRHVDPDRLNTCRRLVTRLANDPGVTLPTAAGGRPLTREDFATVLLLLSFFHQSPNEDGSLPHARARELWKALYECGDLDRCWSNDKWKAIRDFFSGIGYIDWQDQRYYLGELVDGEYVRGQACKWHLADDVAEVINGEEAEAVVLMDNTQSKLLTHPLFIDTGALKPIRAWRFPHRRRLAIEIAGYEDRIRDYFRKKAA